jgi:acetoin utilization protein AcuC
MTGYDFGPQHPLKPERLRRTIALLQATTPDLEILDPGLAAEADVLRIHTLAYMDAVKQGAQAGYDYGFGAGDNPPFAGMHEASLTYLGGSVRAAEVVRDGATLAFNISGGLHHARRDRASGFCIYDDPAVACAILRERFEKVLYVDIDLHHGDGVQWIFYDDPTVVTYSIHQDGRTLYPGTGFVDETGVDLSSINVPLPPRTTGAPWLHAFRETLPLVIEHHRPEAIVLQMGSDPHRLDPLGHLECLAQHWLGAVALVRDLNLPIVALGGGGYNLTTVPRMWTAAVLTLAGLPVPERIPDAIPKEWGMTTFLDVDDQIDHGHEAADAVIEHWRTVLG